MDSLLGDNLRSGGWDKPQTAYSYAIDLESPALKENIQRTFCSIQNFLPELRGRLNLSPRETLGKIESEILMPSIDLNDLRYTPLN